MPKLYKPFCDGEDPKANDSLQKQSMSSCTKKELFIIVLHDCAHIQQGSKGTWCSGESACLPPMWPGFESWRRRHVWVEFVVGSLPCSERFFFGYCSFPLSLKTNTLKFQFDLEHMDMFQRVIMNSSVIRG